MTRKYILCGLFAALTAICAWIGIPMGSICFTLQTFAIFLCLEILGGKWGTVSILCYLLLGAVGVPVFSGFRGGWAALLGVTGGFLWGFLPLGLCRWGFEKLCKPLGSVLGLFACYLCGTVWFVICTGTPFSGAVGICVAPYLIPDAIKLGLATVLARRIRRSLHI